MATVLLSDWVFLWSGVSAVKDLPDPGRSMSIQFRDALEKDIHLLIPAVLYEGGEWTLSDPVCGGGVGQPGWIDFEPTR